MKNRIKQRHPILLALLFFCIFIVNVPIHADFARAMISIPQTVRSANYNLNITIANGSSPLSFANGDALPQGDYTVTLEWAGSALHGYCIVTLDEQIYYTAQIENSSITFHIHTERDIASAFFKPCWGYADNNSDITSGGWTLVDVGSTINITPLPPVVLAAEGTD